MLFRVDTIPYICPISLGLIGGSPLFVIGPIKRFGALKRSDNT